MMREQLQQEHPNVFSLQQEKEIKKHINKLFSQTKKEGSNIEHEENSTLDKNDEEVVNIDQKWGKKAHIKRKKITLKCIFLLIFRSIMKFQITNYILSLYSFEWCV